MTVKSRLTFGLGMPARDVRLRLETINLTEKIPKVVILHTLRTIGSDNIKMMDPDSVDKYLPFVPGYPPASDIGIVTMIIGLVVSFPLARDIIAPLYDPSTRLWSLATVNSQNQSTNVYQSKQDRETPLSNVMCFNIDGWSLERYELPSLSQYLEYIR